MLPAHIQDQGLLLTLRNMVEVINKSGKFKVGFESNIKNRLSDKLEINIYYLIYELINNATKHSNGDSIFVELIEQEHSINLSVEDNGQGFDQTKIKDGMGLRNIKTRTDYLGGKLEIISDSEMTLFIIEIPTPDS
jgi:signal transduction histidine kinase